MRKETRVAVRAAKQAGSYLLKQYRGPGQERRFKKHGEVVTRADLGADRIIKRHIREAFPDHAILSEETGLSRRGSGYKWYVDPLDGTNNFVARIPLFCVSIGVEHDGQMAGGVVYVPVTKELFWAERGAGAWCNGARIRASSVRAMRQGLLAHCYGYGPANRDKAVAMDGHMVRRFKVSRHLGSAGMELAWVATGRIDAAYIIGAKAWDIAAGSVIAREAGATVTDFRGEPWEPGMRDVAASNARLHASFIRAIKRARSRHVT